MSKRKPNRQLANDLASVAAAYQTTAVIPHCTQCAKPCCRLDTLVLELEWKQLKSFWHLEASRNAFDKRLNSGKGPEEIRAGNGLYYIHSKPCPAYNEAGASCRVYGQALKPQGCSDFPVYEDQGSIVADLRCEAVDIDALATSIATYIGPDFHIDQSPDAEFPFLVTVSARRIS